MKKYLSILVAVMLAALSFTLTSCGDDDENEPGETTDNTELLIGTWKETTPSVQQMGYTHYSKISNDGIIIDVTIEDDEVEIGRSTWTLKDNTIYATSLEPELEDLTFEFKILKLSQTELIMSSFGITQTYSRVSDSTLDKYLK